MNQADVGRWLKRNWLIVSLLVAIAAALSWRPNGPDTEAVEPAPASAPIETTETNAPPPQDVLQKQLDDTLLQQEKQRQLRHDAKSQIDEHLAVLDTGITRDEYATRMCALGNLYQQRILDFETAATYYEVLLDNYSDWSGINGVYFQLIACYTQLEDFPSLRLLYRRMLEFFPEDSIEYKYAATMLEDQL